jgi:hypothetical protein
MPGPASAGTVDLPGTTSTPLLGSVGGPGGAPGIAIVGALLLGLTGLAVARRGRLAA